MRRGPAAARVGARVLTAALFGCSLSAFGREEEVRDDLRRWRAAGAVDCIEAPSAHGANELRWRCQGDSLERPEVRFRIPLPLLETRQRHEEDLPLPPFQLDLVLTAVEDYRHVPIGDEIVQMLIGFGRSWTPCGGKTGGKQLSVGSKLDASLLCFPSGRHKDLRDISIEIVTSAPQQLQLQAYGRHPDSLTTQRSSVGGDIGGDFRMFSFSIEDDGLQLTRLRFSSNSSDVVHAYVFHEDSHCIKQRLALGGCANPELLVNCFKSFTFGFGSFGHWNDIALHLSFSYSGEITLSSASGPSRASGRWFVILTCSGRLRDENADCPEKIVDFDVVHEGRVRRRLAMGAALMFFAPVGILVFMDLVYWLSYRLVKTSALCSTENDRSFPHIIGWPTGGCISLFRDNMYKARDPNPFFSSLLVLMVGAFSATAFQFVGSHLGLMQLTGDHDVCFYNEKCFYPTSAYNLPVNNIISHIPYFVAGLHVMVQAVFAEHNCRKAFGRDVSPLDLRSMYAIGWSFIAEGIGSACYHVCPSLVTFQFDTCFMIPICHFYCTVLVDWPRTSRDDGVIAIQYFLYILIPIWFFNFIGTWYDAHIFDAESRPFVYFGLAFSVIAWSCRSLRALNYLIAPENDKGSWGRLFRVGVKGVIIAVLSASVIFPNVRIQLGGMANTFLLLSVVVMLCVVGWQVFSILGGRRFALRDIPMYSVKLTYLVLASVIMVSALKAFGDKVALVEPGVAASASHDENQECLFSVFDRHDLWHSLSAISIALVAMPLLHVKVQAYVRATLDGGAGMRMLADTSESESGE